MHSAINNIIEKIKTLTLRADEKTAMRDSLTRFMETHPLQGSATGAKAPAPLRLPVVSPFEYWLGTLTVGPYRALAAFVFLFVVTGGVSYAAEGALPGDTLYAFKVHVNENTESLLAFDAKTAAEIETKHALLRLQEAEILATAGKLTPELHAAIEANLDDNVKQLDQHVAELNTSGDFATANTVNDALEQAFSNHYALLLNTETSVADTSSLRAMSATETNAEAPAAPTLLVTAPVAPTAPSVASMKFAKTALVVAPATNTSTSSVTEMKLLEVRTYIEEHATASTSQKLLKTVNDRLDKAFTFLNEGKQKSADGKNKEAEARFKQAARIAEEAKVTFAIGIRVVQKPTESESKKEEVKLPESRDRGTIRQRVPVAEEKISEPKPTLEIKTEDHTEVKIETHSEDVDSGGLKK
jgi:hypothetical protein